MKALYIVCVVALIYQGCRAKSLEVDVDRRQVADCDLDTAIEGTVGVCFICDQKCQARLGDSSYSNDKDSFFANLLTDLTNKFGFAFVEFYLQKVVYESFNRGSELSGYMQAATPGQESSATNAGFWTSSRRNYYKGAPYYCDMTFLFTEFATTTGVIGAAFSSGICTTYSNGFLMIKDNPDTKFNYIAAGFAHEVGHAFGMFHDGYAWGQSDLDKFGKCKAKIAQACPPGIMSSMVQTNNGFFTDCSKAYYFFWQKKAKDNDIITHSHNCIHPAVGTTTAPPSSGSGEE